jgi:hypothetical protein
MSSPKPKRRWFQFSLRTLLLLPLVLALVLSAVYSWPYVERWYVLWRLQDYVDKDLRKLGLNEQRQVAQWTEKLIGKNRGPLLFHNVDIPGVGRRMLIVELQAHTPSYIPVDDCRLHLLDTWGRATQTATLNVEGNPISASFGDSRHGFLSLMLETDNVEPFGAVRYLYRFSDGYAELMRVEKPDGTLLRHRSFGPSPSTSELQNLLSSLDCLQQLRGLAAYLYSGSSADKVVDDKVRNRLTDLANSPDPWISEEAMMALEVK